MSIHSPKVQYVNFSENSYFTTLKHNVSKAIHFLNSKTSHSVSKQSIHRMNDSEIFLYKAAKLSSTQFAFFSHSPAHHPYYSDNLYGSLDPLSLLESARQAETFLAHTYLSIPYDYKFVLTNWKLKLPDSQNKNFNFGAKYTNFSETGILIISEIKHIKMRNALPYYVEYNIFLYSLHNFTVLGEITLAVNYINPTVYTQLRTNKRTSVLPSSDTYRCTKRFELLPRNFGRTRPENIVLTDVTSHESTIKARICIHGDHPGYFDHPQDHIPGMMQAECAYQMAFYYMSENYHKKNEFILLSSLKASFLSYAELDSPVWLEINPLKSEYLSTFDLRFIQKNEVITHMSLELESRKRH